MAHPASLLAPLQWFKDTTWARRGIQAVNVVGIAYGFYYYGAQFGTTPAWLWPFVPDSPLAVMWAFLALLAFGIGRRSDVLDTLAFVANVQVGLWTTYVLIVYRADFGTIDFGLNFVLFWAHLAMVALALLFVPDLRRAWQASRARAWRVLGGVAAWLLFNDYLDYFAFRNLYGNGCSIRPYTVPCDLALEPALAAVTFALSALSVAALAWLTLGGTPGGTAHGHPA